MELSKKEIEHIAHLSRIKITEKEKENFAGQLSEILSYVRQLEKVDTSKVEATARVSDLSNMFDEDEVISSELSKEKLMENAPEQFDGYFKVKAVLEENDK